ncbi:MAG: gamma-glutamylcyclotransferase family protein [Bacteroidota bacterium]
MINDLLFVYGSLLDTDNEFGRYLNDNSTLFGAGKFNGRLYDIGEYPGAIIGNENSYPIYGSVCKLKNPEVLTALDDYEGFGPDQEQPNLFIRELLPIETSDGTTNCWVYLYNLEVDGFVEITSGDYKTYLKQK